MKARLIGMLSTLSYLNKEKMFQLLVVVKHPLDKFYLEGVHQLLKSFTDEAANQIGNAVLQGGQQLKGAEAGVQESFVSLVKISELESVLTALSAPHIMMLYDIVNPNAPRQDQIHVFTSLHGQLSQMSEGTLRQLSGILRGLYGEALLRELRRLMPMQPHLYYLYDPLRVLFSLGLPELLGFHRAFTQLQRPSQMEALSSILQLPNYDALLLRSIFVPLVVDEPEIAFDTGMDLGEEDNSGEEEDEVTLRVQVISEPPRACVYRRIQKPPPMVKIVGDDHNVQGRLELRGVLIQVNSMEPCEARFVTGPQVYTVTPGKVVEFKKLKIQQTSKQNGDTPFVWSFELYEHRDDEDEPRLIHKATSTPFNVVSHSSQLKKRDTLPLPTVAEVIPSYGTVAGGTKVVLLGDHFVNVPALRVRFGNQEVPGNVRSTKTIVCRTPLQKQSGEVKVSVSCDSRKYGKKGSTFQYVVVMESDSDEGAEEDAAMGGAEEEDVNDGEYREESPGAPPAGQQVDIGRAAEWPSGSANLDLGRLLSQGGMDQSAVYHFRTSASDIRFEEGDF